MGLTRVSGDILQTPLNVGVVTATRIDGDVSGNVNSTGVSTFTTLKVGTGVTISGGIVTATSFVGNVTGNATGLSGTPNITVGNIIASSATISGNVSVAGTVTYDDVTNVDSLGVGTFRSGIVVNTGTATTALVVNGSSRITGILSVGQGTITINGNTDKITTPKLDYAGISSTISDNAVDVFVYDTRKDSDGGAWRKRTQHTSWYNETLNTATRGSRRDFPAVAVIVSTLTTVTIYDGDDPDMPMWMVFEGQTGGDTANSRMLQYANTNGYFVHALNGILVVGQKSNGDNYGNPIIRFISEYVNRMDAQTFEGGVWNGNIANRNGTVGYRVSSTETYGIVNSIINDVAMTVLPNAPIDSATGLPVPTIAVATNGGVSVIKDDGTVFDVIDTNSARICYDVSFTKDHKIMHTGDLGAGSTHAGNVFVTNVLTADRTEYDNHGDLYRWYSTSSMYPRINGGNTFNTRVLDPLDVGGHHYAMADVGISLIEDGTSTSFGNTDGMVAYATTSYNTGWMHGDIKGAFLSDTVVSSGISTVIDRSVNNNGLQVFGTIATSAVATGAELVAYSGFSASNYLRQPYNSLMEFGTGDFYMMAWVKNADTTNNQKIMTRDLDGSNRVQLYMVNDSGYKFALYTQDAGSNSYIYTSSTGVNNGSWSFVVAGRKSSTLQMYYNANYESGEGSSNTTTARDISYGSSAPLEIGRTATSTADYWRGSIALARIGAGFPSADQIKKIYEDEKVLFQENAACTLYGSSDAVTALAYDDSNDLLHVGTSSGRSDFQGLRRINNTTTAVTTAISASNGLVAEQ